MFIISKEFHFSASHILNGLRDQHPCARMHGHNYIVTIYLRNESLDNAGFVTDYNDLDPIKNYIDQELDHRHLNDVFPDINPSAELIAQRIYTIFKPQFPALFKIEVSETPKTKASYEE